MEYVISFEASPRFARNDGLVRDANGHFHVVSTETEKSTQPPVQAPAKQKSDTAAESPQEKPRSSLQHAKGSGRKKIPGTDRRVQ